MKKNKILVVIPARGGSKRIPKKNIKKIGNKPMIEWPIIELLNIFKKDQILISTDDLASIKIGGRPATSTLNDASLNDFMLRAFLL